MPTPVSTFTRAATRRDDEKLNILTSPTHERYEVGLAQTGHNFYAWRGEGIKDWNSTYAPLPSNYTLLNPREGVRQIPLSVDIDLVLSQNKFGQFQVLSQVARQLQVPLISLEHTLPMPNWHPAQVQELRRMRGDHNIFISNYSRGMWGWSDEDATVVRHGVDTELFAPNNEVVKERHALSVVNDWINRDWCCGYRIWEELTKNLPVRVVGNTPGLSKPAGSTSELANEYQRAQVFVNTSTVSPVPTALLEAMACGCAVVTLSNCMIPEVVEHGVNGCCTNDKALFRACLQELLNSPERAAELGAKARATIEERFTLDRFTNEWNGIFANAVLQ